MEKTIEEIKKYREIFVRRRSMRIAVFITILSLLIIVFILGFPSWRLFGMEKMTWVLLFYIIMFGPIIMIAFVWRCPVCNGLLGEVLIQSFA